MPRPNFLNVKKKTKLTLFGFIFLPVLIVVVELANVAEKCINFVKPKK